MLHKIVFMTKYYNQKLKEKKIVLTKKILWRKKNASCWRKKVVHKTNVELNGCGEKKWRKP